MTPVWVLCLTNIGIFMDNIRQNPVLNCAKMFRVVPPSCFCQKSQKQNKAKAALPYMTEPWSHTHLELWMVGDVSHQNKYDTVTRKEENLGQPRDDPTLLSVCIA